MLRKLVTGTAVFFAAASQAQIQLLNISATDGIPSLCISVLNQQVTCDSALLAAGNAVQNGPVFGTPQFFNSSQLTALCTTTCQNMLTTWMRRIAGACGTTLYEQPDGGKAVPAAIAENFVEVFNSVCLKNACVLCSKSIWPKATTNQDITCLEQAPSATWLLGVRWV
jgi:hypothetical protein